MFDVVIHFPTLLATTHPIFSNDFYLYNRFSRMLRCLDDKIIILQGSYLDKLKIHYENERA